VAEGGHAQPSRPSTKIPSGGKVSSAESARPWIGTGSVVISFGVWTWLPPNPDLLASWLPYPPHGSSPTPSRSDLLAFPRSDLLAFPRSDLLPDLLASWLPYPPHGSSPTPSSATSPPRWRRR